MKRKQYIRFFVSSTFADMEKERNLLRSVFDELNKKYTTQGWQIESIDLRWGVTSEASLDNRTMRICLQELQRCKELSPKPNFILLLGERYGWIPLPEILPIDIGMELLEKANESERLLFNKWYLLDLNSLPKENYILQPRKGRYKKYKIWKDEVEKPLLSFILRNYDNYFCSATEYEIRRGALEVDNAKEHVVGYFRTLRNVPEEYESVFVDDDTDDNLIRRKRENLESLKRKLFSKLSDNNIYSENVSYDDYNSQTNDDFSTRFKSKMTNILTRIIDNVIDNYEKETDLNSINIRFAEEYTNLFVGRESELSFVDNYINNKAANHALWLKSKSGTGKTALACEIINKYKKTHNIICRFCGLQENPSDEGGFLNSICKDLLRFYPDDKCKQNLDVKDLYYILVGCGYNRLKGIKVDTKPLLIVIDGIDQLDQAHFRDLLRLKLVDCKFAPNVKVLITSTDTYDLDVPVNEIEIFSMEGMDKSSMTLINDILKESNRKITQNQLAAVELAVAQSDKTPIYLTLLANYLKDITSYTLLPPIPSNIEDLVRFILHHVKNSNNHDHMFVMKALALFVADRIGLSDDEIVHLLALDEELIRHIKGTSFHEWKELNQQIPPIMWFRLYADISFFFRLRSNTLGTFNYIYHNEMRRVISSLCYKTNKEKLYARKTLYQYYKGLGTPHSLSEIVYCCYEAFVFHYNEYGYGGGYETELYNLMHDLNFLAKRKVQDSIGLSYELSYDFKLLYKVAEITMPDKKEEILNLNNDISEMYVSSVSDFLNACFNVHKDSVLYNIRNKEKEGIVLKDKLSNLFPYGTITYSSSTFGDPIRLSNDGSRLLFIDKNAHEVILEDMKNLTESRQYTLKDKIIDIDVSEDFNIHAFVTSTCCYIYDSKNQKLIDQIEGFDGLLWVSISNDGQHYCYGGKNGMYSNDFGDSALSMTSGKISPSGKYLWTFNNKDIIRWSLNDEWGITLPLEKFYDSTEGSLSIKIVADDQCVFVSKSKLFRLFIEDNGTNEKEMKYYVESINYPEEKFIGAICDNTFVFVEEDTGLCYLDEITSNGTTNLENTYCYGISAISANLKYAYVKGKNVVCDFPSLLKKFRVCYRCNCGVINSLATDFSGNRIIYTYGINQLAERPFDRYISIEDYSKFHIKKLDNVKTFISACAISPKGDKQCFAKLRPEEIVLQNEYGCTLSTIPIQDMSIESMAFTEDGEYVVAVSGARIADPPTDIFIIDKEGTLIKHIDGKKLNTKDAFRGTLLLSHNNRYAILKDSATVIDLIEERVTVIGEGVQRTLFSRDGLWELCNFDSLFGVSPFEYLIGGEKTSLCEFNGKKYVSDKYNKKIISISHSGRYYFSLDESNNLYAWDSLKEKENFLLKHIEEVHPTYNEQYIYAIGGENKNRIVLFDIYKNKIVQQAVFPYCYLYAVTNLGLVAITKEGKASLFSPDDFLGVNKCLSVTIARHWNLATKQRKETPTAVCPACGHEFVPNSKLIDIISFCQIFTPDDNYLSNILLSECPCCHTSLKFNPIII